MWTSDLQDPRNTIIAKSWKFGRTSKYGSNLDIQSLQLLNKITWQKLWWNQMQWQLGSYGNPTAISGCKWDEILNVSWIWTEPIRIHPCLMSWAVLPVDYQLLLLLLFFEANAALPISNPSMTSTVSIWRTPWLRKLLDITLQLPILVSISMVNLQCFRPAAYPFSSVYYPSLSKIHKLDSIICLVVPEHGSNSSCTSRTKLRLMPAYTHGDFMAFKSLPDLKSLPPSYSTDFPGIG